MQHGAEGHPGTILPDAQTLELMPVAISVCDASGVLLRFNRRAVSLWGRQPPGDARYCGAWRLYGVNGTLLAPQDTPQAEALRTGLTVNGRKILIEQPHGERRTVEVSVEPQRGAEGPTRGATTVYFDVTGHSLQAEAGRQREDQLQLILDEAPVSLARCDREGRYRFVNRNYAERFGRQPVDFIGKTLAEALGEEAYASFRGYVEMVLCGRPVEFEVEVPYAQMGRRHMHCAYVPELNAVGKPEGWLAVVTDVTERRRMVERLREETRVNEALHRIGRRLAGELDLDRLLRIVTDEVRLLVGAEIGALFFNDPGEARSGQAGAYRLAALSGPPAEAFAGVPLPRVTALLAPTYSGKGPVRLDDITRHPQYGENAPYHGLPDGHPPVRSYLAVPIMSRSGEVLGGLFFGHAEPGVFALRDEQLALGMAAQAAVAIDNARLFESVRRERQRAETSERHYRVLAELVPQLVWTMAPNGGVDWCNQRWSDATGMSLRETAGDGWASALHPDDRDRTLDALRSAVVLGETFEAEFRLRDPGVAHRWYLARAVPLRGPGGEVVKWFATCTDIEEQKRTAEALRISRERLALVVRSTELGLWYCDLPFDRLNWNAKCKEHFGLPPTADVTIRTFYERLHPDDRDRVRQGIELSLKRGTSYDVIYRTLATDGTLRWIRAIGRGFYDEHGTPTRFDGVTVDVTRQKRVEQSLREADRRKDVFLATLAHELRNPLAPVVNALRVLRLAGDDRKLAEDARAMMERQIRQIVRLVDDLLDVSRISRGKIELRKQRVQLAAVVSSALETSRPTIEAAGHQLHVSVPAEPVELDGDPMRLAQVLSNLLNNAAKYTPPSGDIWLTATLEGIAEVLIRVRDTGIGLAPEMLSRVFDTFVQAEGAVDHAQGGLGIGLMLVKNLVRMHGGTVTAHSEGLGRGSEFTVRLPRPAAGTSRRKSSVKLDGETGEPLRVLVADDNVDAATSLGLLLRLMGHEAEVVHDGPAALGAVRQQRPDVAILDIGMPGMDGYEVARQLRQSPELTGLTLAALTGWGQEEDRKRSRDAGFDVHLVKPVDPEALQRLLARVGRE